MRQLVNALKELKGKHVHISTAHGLFGHQCIEMEFDPETELGVGFRCKGQSIYITDDELVSYSIKDDEIWFESALMCVKIKHK